MGHAKHFAKRVQSVGQAEHARRKTVTLQPPCSHRDVIHLANCSQRKWAKINHPSLVFVSPIPLEGNFCQPTPPTVPPNDHPPQTSKIAWFYPPSQLLVSLFLNPVNIVASEDFYRSDPGFYNEPGVLQVRGLLGRKSVFASARQKVVCKSRHLPLQPLAQWPSQSNGP